MFWNFQSIFKISKYRILANKKFSEMNFFSFLKSFHEKGAGKKKPVIKIKHRTEETPFDVETRYQKIS